MKTSLIIISALLILSVFLPFFYFIYNGLKNTNKIVKKAEAIIKNNGIKYTIKDIWHQNFIGLSDDKKTLTYLQMNDQNPININILLSELKQCNIIVKHSKGADKVVSLNQLDLEIIFKTSNKANIMLNFYSTDNDLAEDFEMQRIEKWHTIIKNALPDKIISRMAS